eukprot:2723744-Karenia_brevis.AAC.1
MMMMMMMMMMLMMMVMMMVMMVVMMVMMMMIDRSMLGLYGTAICRKGFIIALVLQVEVAEIELHP